MPVPDIDDYLDLFRLYGGRLDKIYLTSEKEDQYRFLFEQVCRLLAQSSGFNLAMPRPFVTTAQKYLAGDAGAVAKLSDPEVRHFMLSDLYDYIELQARLAGKWPEL